MATPKIKANIDFAVASLSHFNGFVFQVFTLVNL